MCSFGIYGPKKGIVIYSDLATTPKKISECTMFLVEKKKERNRTTIF